jgi:hypothetical protein
MHLIILALNDYFVSPFCRNQYQTYWGVRVKGPVLLSDFNQISSVSPENIASFKIYKNPASGPAQILHTDRRTNVAKHKIAFRYESKSAYKDARNGF